MEKYLRSLESEIKSLRRQIARENRELQDMSKSLNDELCGFSIESTVGFMKTNIDHLIKASTKLTQLEDAYNTLKRENKQ